MFSGIRWRLIFYFLVVSAAVVLVMGTAFTWFLRYYYLETLRSSLFNQGRLAAALMEELFQRGAAPDEFDELCKSLGIDLGLRFTLVDLHGNVLGDSLEIPSMMGNYLNRPEIKEALTTGRGEASRYSTAFGEEMLYLALPLSDGARAPSEPMAVLRLSLPLSRIDTAVARLRLFMLIALFVSAAVALTLGIFLAKKITSPVKKAMYAAKSIAEGNFTLSLDTGGRGAGDRDEMSALSRAIKDMGRSLSAQLQQIRLEKKKLEAALFSMESAVILLDGELKVELLNPAAEKVFNIKRERAVGMPARVALRHYSLYENLRSVYDRGRPCSFEFDLFYPHLTLQASMVPVRNDAGTVVGVLALFHDITAFRSLEKMRHEFAANVSHELRTPLTVIKGYAETILGEEQIKNGQLISFLQIIDREAGRLSRLVDSLLDLSLIEEQKKAFRKQPVELLSLALLAIEDVASKCSEKKMRIETDFPPQPLFVQGNPDWLRQAMVNVLDNSICYGSPKGVIQIKVACQESLAVVRIIDDGPGIPAADLPHLFERFYRVDKARSRRRGGVGLGLSIVKHIMEAHGAFYGIQSEEGRGTIFYFKLPAHIEGSLAGPEAQK